MKPECHRCQEPLIEYEIKQLNGVCFQCYRQMSLEKNFQSITRISRFLSDPDRKTTLDRINAEIAAKRH